MEGWLTVTVFDQDKWSKPDEIGSDFFSFLFYLLGIFFFWFHEIGCYFYRLPHMSTPHLVATHKRVHGNAVLTCGTDGGY